MFTAQASGRAYLAPDFGKTGVRGCTSFILPGDFGLWASPTVYGMNDGSGYAREK